MRCCMGDRADAVAGPGAGVAGDGPGTAAAGGVWAIADVVSGRAASVAVSVTASAAASAAVTIIRRLKRAVHAARVFMAYPTNGVNGLSRFSMKTIPV